MRASFFFIVMAFLSIGVSGCFVGSGKPEPAYYDFAGGEFSRRLKEKDMAGGAMFAPAFNLRRVDVRAPTWLDSSTMQYRLADKDVNRRMSFSGSRWVASPPELLEAILKRRFMSADGRPDTGGCRLQVELDEFIQVFDGLERSLSVMEARVTLFSVRDTKLLVRRGFSYAMPVGADARAGVAGFGEAVAKLSADLNVWLAGLDQVSPVLAGQCRA